nr:tetratricopeptide repeat protein [Deltaproteobacteria bacterium]
MVTPARDREAIDQAIVRGSDLLKQGKVADAQRAFRQALDIDPENQKIMALLGLTHFRANELDAARPIYEELVELAPTDASHRLNLGLVYLKLNDAERAINSLEASRSLDPSQGRAVSYLGLAYARAGRYAEAFRSFLMAGQNELATEIEVNLTQTERDGILAQLGRPPGGPIAKAPEPMVARKSIKAPAEPRTKPPGAPPKRSPDPSPPSSSAIAIQMTGSGSIQIVKPEHSSPEITIEPEPATNITASQRFVLSSRETTELQARSQAVPVAIQSSRLSQAVASVVPASTSAARTMSGAYAARALSEIATEELIRPDDSADAFEIEVNGALLIRVTDRVLTRLEGVHVTGGDLSYEVATRRSRGHQTDEQFERPMHVVSGKGYLIAMPPKDQRFSAVQLDDDILYLREDLIFAFESTLRWENGNVPGLRGKVHVVQFRGDGALALRLARPLTRVKLPPSGLVFVDAERLAGWIGRVIPRAVVSPLGGPLGTTCVECTGEGIVLVEPAPEGSHAVMARSEPPPPHAGRLEPLEPAPLPDPEPASSEVAPEVADFAADLTAFNAA